MLILPSMLIVIALISCSCENMFFNCIHGNGRVIVKERSISYFDEISSSGSFEVFITQDSIHELKVEAENNILPYISTHVRNGRLVIKNRDNRCIREHEPIRIYIKTPELYKLKLSGSGLITCEDLVTDYLEIDVSGSGEIEIGIETEYIGADVSGSGQIELWGSSVETDLNVSGSGQIRAFDLSQEKCFANISGSGRIYVFINELLDVNISGSGRVYYRGDPELNVRISGSGQVIKD
ncbi:hypothetical protein ES705_12855 [subsurface metagenome]